MAAILDKFPKLRVCAAHLGGLRGRMTRTPFLAPLRKGWVRPRWSDRKAAAGRARWATQEPYGHRQQSATERRPGGPCLLGDAGALQASTAGRGVPLPSKKHGISRARPGQRGGVRAMTSSVTDAAPASRRAEQAARAVLPVVMTSSSSQQCAPLR